MGSYKVGPELLIDITNDCVMMTMTKVGGWQCSLGHKMEFGWYGIVSAGGLVMFHVVSH